ncbi:MAG TPA: DUF4157 domain-containing protein, partial [Pilimelia sp.]|nr:DUF4157 domain-containing protein [Pilimelia sp.]
MRDRVPDGPTDDRSQEAATTPRNAAPDGSAFLLSLQGTAGNGAVLRMLQGDPAVGAAVPPTEAFGLATGGGARPVPMRAEMEQAFGADFGGVRAHLGGSAAREGLGLLGARAATYGSTVVFRDAAPPAELIAHELAHVVQQGAAPAVQGAAVGVSRPDSREERAAEAAGQA